jgi:hypothetical protein
MKLPWAKLWLVIRGKCIWLGVECAHKLKGKKSLWLLNLTTFRSMLGGMDARK